MPTAPRPDQARALAHYGAIAEQARQFAALKALTQASREVLAGHPALIEAEAVLAGLQPALPVPDVADSDFGAFEAAVNAGGQA